VESKLPPGITFQLLLHLQQAITQQQQFAPQQPQQFRPQQQQQFAPQQQQQLQMQEMQAASSFSFNNTATKYSTILASQELLNQSLFQQVQPVSDRQ
jgi:hypothetical protein